MAQQWLGFNDLPTEALFGFFCALDPFLLGTYSLICKKWFQMSKDNELWRQYCIERWDKNAKESDCVKNWLIPVREGGATKENRIDWKRCYLLRSQYACATKFLHLFEAPKTQRHGLRTKKSGKRPGDESYDLFAQGWPSAEDLSDFEKRIQTGLTDVIARVDEEEIDVEHMPNYRLTSLIFELELSVLRRINISRLKYLGFAGRYLELFPLMSRRYPSKVPPRLAEFAAQFTELALERDVPMELITNMLNKISKVFIDLIRNVTLPEEFDNHLTRFISVVVSVSFKLLQTGLRLGQNTKEDARPTPPTSNVDEIMQNISMALVNRPEDGMPLFLDAVELALGALKTKEDILTMLLVIYNIAPNCEQFVLSHVTRFMSEIMLPHWKHVNDAEYLVALLYFSSEIMYTLSGEVLTRYAGDIIRPLLAMSKHENHNVQREVACFVFTYCENLKNPDALVPYLADLLDVMYKYFASTYASVRKEAIVAVGMLILGCRTFDKYSDRMMTEFGKLLTNGRASDRGIVTEIISRIGAEIGENNSSLSADIEVLYNQVIEDCKRDRDGHIDMLLRMTQFTIVSLGSKITKYLDLVFPLIIESSKLSVIQKTIDNEVDDQMEVENEDSGQEFSTLTVDKVAFDRRFFALGAILSMTRHLDRDTFLNIHEDIREALSYALVNVGTVDSIPGICAVYESYIIHLFQIVNTKWCTTERMFEYWSAAMNVFCESMMTTSLMNIRRHCVKSLSEIFEHFCQVSTPSQPFLTHELMKEFTEEHFNALWIQYYEAEADGIPFEELHDYGSDIIDFLDIVCKTRTDKEMFWSFADPILARIGDVIESEMNEYRWYDACLISTVFEHFGYEFMENDRIQYVNLLATCIQIDTNDMYRCLANHLGVLARKFPKILPQDDTVGGLLSFPAPILIGSRSQRAGPAAHDNALMALSSLVLFVYSVYEKSTDEQDQGKFADLISSYFIVLVSALPPAEYGDLIEARICIEQFCQLLQKPQIYFKDENRPELKRSVIKVLKETLEMPECDTPEMHQLVDPVLDSLEAQ